MKPVSSVLNGCDIIITSVKEDMSVVCLVVCYRDYSILIKSLLNFMKWLDIIQGAIH